MKPMNAGANSRPVTIAIRAGFALLLLALGAGIYHFAARNGASSRAASDADELPSGEADAIRSAVESVLRTQEAAWNRSDIDAFMEHYCKSDLLAFSSGGKTTRGWTETLNHYRERYPTPGKMGRLSLSHLEITPLGNSAALVLGQWSLERESEPISGNFSLVFRKLNDRWVIVHDHTSQLKD
jgi:ketosteroid isomerase-like protein